ncbi:MAG: AI-2E family transporter [Treponemataceae bacterium]|nr:AI-2E family transporter [Treponemataceae bacterium]
MEFKSDKNSIQNIFLFGLFVLMFVLVAMIFKPFLSVILWALLIYFLMNPLYKRIIGKFNKNKSSYSFLVSLMSGVFSLMTILLIFVFFFILFAQLLTQFASFLASAEKYFIEHPDFMNESDFAIKLSAFLEKINVSTEWMKNFNMRSQLISLFQNYSSTIFNLSKSLIGGTGNLLVSFAFMIFILFFFYRDGAYLSNLFIKAMPINQLYMTKLLNKFSEVLRGLTSGYLMVAFYQGIVSLILMLIFKVPSALLFSVVLMFASFIPMLGAAIVWAPIGIVMCITKSIWQGIVYMILSAILVSGLDNFIRPMLLKDRIKVHPLIIFFAILGGIKIFGINGLILGPLVIIMFFTLLDLLSNDAGNLDQSEDSINSYEEKESGLTLKINALIEKIKASRKR